MVAEATDKGVPALSSQINVDVAIQRDSAQLQFVLNNYSGTTSERQPVGFVVANPRAIPGVSVIMEQYARIISLEDDKILHRPIFTVAN